VEILRDFDREIMDLERALPRCDADEQDFETYAASYVNILERIAKLNLDKKILDDMAAYFETNFKTASSLEGWYALIGDDTKQEPGTHRVEYWKNLGKYCSKHKIERNKKFAQTFWDNWDCYKKSLA